jgi:8-oxo-dGTP pyrophosphatase MutT (NUDIX family)
MSSNAEVRAPRPSATVMLLREAADGVEVLMTRRHEKLAFMGGLWVFPGGTLHPSDAAPRILARIPNPSLSRCQSFGTLNGPALPSEECLSLAVAACRETFEETGLLLALHADGRPCSNETYQRLQAERPLVATQPEHFAILLEREQLLLDVDRLVYWAHWITPASAPRRFDTRFFAVAAATGQVVTADSTETMECRWMSPAAIAAAAERGEMPISPPTLCNVIDLRESYQRHGSLQAVLHAETQRRVPPILPKMLNEAAQTTVVMPWDPDYASLAGEGAPAHIEYPAGVRAQLSRLTLPRR